MKDHPAGDNEDDLKTDLQVTPDGRARVVLEGWLNARSVPACWTRLEHGLATAKISSLEVDTSHLEVCDGAGFSLLRYLNMGRMTPAATVTLVGLSPQLEKIFRGFTAVDYETFRAPAPRKCHSLPLEVGVGVAQVGADLREQVVFLGEVAASFPATLANPKLMRWAEVRRIFEQAGANAVPIISLISFLVGLIIAFETAQPLARLCENPIIW